MAGDILFIFVTLPVRLVVTWWQNPFAYKDRARAAYADAPGPESRREHEVKGTLPRSPSPSESSLSHQPQPPRRQPSARRLAYRDGGTRRHASDSYQPPNNAQKRVDRVQRSLHEPITNANARMAGIQPPTKAQVQRRATKMNTPPSRRPSDKPIPPVQHQSRYPPASSFGERSESDEPMPIETSTSSASSIGNDSSPRAVASSANAQVTHIEISEWRLCPPFPASYPLTPLPVSASSHSNGAAVFQHSSSNVPLPLVSLYDPAEPPVARPSLPPREPLKRGFNTSSSDGDGVNGSRRKEWPIATDSADDEGEDDFDLTLKTHLPPIRSTRTRSHTSNLSTATSSVNTRSTTLTTVGNGSSMHTRTESESSDSISASDSMSISDHSMMVRKMNAVPQPAEVLGSSRNTVTSHREMLGWMAGVGAARVDDGYDATSSDNESDISSPSSDENVNPGAPTEQVTPTQPRTRPAAQPPPARTTSTTNGVTARPTSRTREAPPVVTRKSSRIAGLGIAPPISRHVTAPAPGPPHTGAYTASAVHRHASDKNPARRK